jgi:hypothetical protein
MNSKVKFERFILIINNSSKMKKEELNALMVKIYGSVKKILTSGKQGVNFKNYLSKNSIDKYLFIL